MKFRAYFLQRLLPVVTALNSFAYRYYSKDRATPAPSMVLDEYVTGMPKAQNAIDILPGWNHGLPPETGVVAGAAGAHDPRILWAIEQYGDLGGKTVLELGPLEAAHTAALDRHAPEAIHAIEANKLSFLRCLVVKEILDLKHAKFFLGDFMPWLEQTPQRYDFIVASGVLYHMADPVRLLELMAQRSDAIFLWTHYFDAEAMPAGDMRRAPFVGEVEVRNVHGVPVHLHARSYHGAWQSKSFCGGLHDLHRWMERDDILALLRALGFDDIRIAHEAPDHPNGPSFSVFARRTA